MRFLGAILALTFTILGLLGAECFLPSTPSFPPIAQRSSQSYRVDAAIVYSPANVLPADERGTDSSEAR